MSAGAIERCRFGGYPIVFNFGVYALRGGHGRSWKRGQEKMGREKKNDKKESFFIFYFLWRYYRKKIALNKGKKKKEPIVTLKLGIMLWS